MAASEAVLPRSVVGCFVVGCGVAAEIGMPFGDAEELKQEKALAFRTLTQALADLIGIVEHGREDGSRHECPPPHTEFPICPVATRSGSKPACMPRKIAALPSLTG
ncbi:MAG TPA: hypothetical protein VNE82_08415 [Candidatus Binataceae bacterium]|nr:hypothetical protein [Candidatus Binataceae bacterium]